ncbi:tyrosine-type recombinase/integrase [Methanolacinia paynteri]|uniref:tyrosine-type recombinase/integrase n=1 Tax=Methanolacinia paynteri TaxID=230356 RepID=UPI00064F415F|nr:tyrosine-type recombinase/integrase [Methanolacinia paynteri]
MDVIGKLNKLDSTNKKYLEQFSRHLKLIQNSPQTIKTKLWRIYTFLIWLDFKDAKETTQEDIENYYLLRCEKVSPFTVQGDMLDLKLFFRWLVPENEKELFKNIKSKRPRNHLPVDRLITRSDIIKMVEVCEKPRDRALIMILWDTGARISEILNLNIGHIQFDRYGAVAIVTGKTGMRRLRLISSVPELQNWVNMHPYRNDSDAPLFVTSRCYGKTQRRLNSRTVENKFKKFSKDAGIKKRVHPHAIRHARLTDLTKSNGNKKGLSEMELRIVAGWEKNSSMPEVYIHLSGADVERKLLENAGIIDDESDPADNALEPCRCPRCKTMNPHGALYCVACSMALTEEAAMEIETKNQKAKESSEYEELFDRLKKDLMAERGLS